MTLAKRRGPRRSSKNSRCVSELWCRAWTYNTISSCDIAWYRGMLGHLFHQHASNIAWTPGRKKDLSSLDPRIAQKKVRVDWWIEMLEKYDRSASKDVYKIFTGAKSWIYAYELETKQQFTLRRQAKFNEGCWYGKSTAKQIVACFFDKTGYVATVPLEHRWTVNSEWYTTICLPKVFGEIPKTNKRRRIIVHQLSHNV